MARQEPCLCGDPECPRCFPDFVREDADADEQRRERLDEEADKVLAEIGDGRHDDELLNSPFVDALHIMRLARAHADNDLWLQIDDYARDVAERRMLR